MFQSLFLLCVEVESRIKLQLWNHQPNLHIVTDISPSFFFDLARHRFSAELQWKCEIKQNVTFESPVLWFDNVVFTVRRNTLWDSLGTFHWSSDKPFVSKRRVESINICFSGLLAFMIITAEQHWSVFMVKRLIKSCAMWFIIQVQRECLLSGWSPCN